MNRPLRWTVLATQVPAGGRLGGIVRYTTEVLAALAARDDVVVTAVTTAAAADTVRPLVGGRGRVITAPDLPTPVLALTERRFAGRLVPEDSDVVHGMKHLVPRTASALRVLTVHDMLLLDRPADFGMAKRLLLPGFYRSSIRDADLLLCVSEATRQRVEALLPGSVEKAGVVHLATSTTLRTSAPRPLASLAGNRFALVVGDPTPRKNLGTVVSAWAAVRAQQPQAVLAIAGPPSWGRSDMGAQYDELVRVGGIVPLGHVDDAGLRWAYEHADAVLCPSIAEGFGLPAAEAVHFGTPVVISDDPALQEASAGHAEAVLPATDVDRWASAAIDIFQRDQRVPSPSAFGSRTWAEVADDTVAAVRRAIRLGGR